MTHVETDNIAELKKLFRGTVIENDLLQQIAGQLPAIVYAYDAGEGKVQFMNRQMENVLGYSLADLTSTGTNFMQLVPEEDQEGVKTSLNAYHTLPLNGSYTYDVRLKHREGSTRSFRAVGTVVQRNDAGHAITLLFIAQDISDLQQKAAASESVRLKKYEQELEIKVEELNRSNLELEEFAYVASHDMQEPLRKLTTFGERLRQKCSDQLTEEGIGYLNRMLASAESMRVLIDNLLEFSRVTRMHHPFERKDLNQLLREVCNEMDLEIDEAGVTIVIDTLPFVELIPVQIKQLFSNLLSNAIKFRKPATPLIIRISSSKLNKTEKELLKLKVSKNYLRIVMNDNGIGFEEAYAERIFQLFQRLHGKAEYPGSGIGLAICKKIAENHKGLIMAEGVPMQGASFSIILPEKQNV